MCTYITFTWWELKFWWLHFQNAKLKCEIKCNGMCQLHQCLWKTLFGTCTCLCNLVQPQKDKKLQVPQAMSKFSQVAALKSLHGLLRSLCGICIIQSPIIYYLKIPWEPETLSVCWCRCHRCHWQQWPFLICVLLSSIKRILWWQYYSISALDQLATHKPRASCRRSAQSLDLCLVNLSTTKKGSKRPKRAERFFTVLLMS